MNQLPTPVRLRQGESISLLTGQVTPSFARANWPSTMIPTISVWLNLRLSANDLNALRSTFQVTACAWTAEACHRYVAQCGQHPRKA